MASPKSERLVHENEDQLVQTATSSMRSESEEFRWRQSGTDWLEVDVDASPEDHVVAVIGPEGDCTQQVAIYSESVEYDSGDAPRQARKRIRIKKLYPNSLYSIELSNSTTTLACTKMLAPTIQNIIHNQQPEKHATIKFTWEPLRRHDSTDIHVFYAPFISLSQEKNLSEEVNLPLLQDNCLEYVLEHPHSFSLSLGVSITKSDRRIISGMGEQTRSPLCAYIQACPPPALVGGRSSSLNFRWPQGAVPVGSIVEIARDLGGPKAAVPSQPGPFLHARARHIDNKSEHELVFNLLDSATWYWLRVCKNLPQAPSGVVSLSETIAVRTPAARPLPPTDIDASYTLYDAPEIKGRHMFIKLRWKPSDDRGADIEEYIVQRRNLNEKEWKIVYRTTSCACVLSAMVTSEAFTYACTFAVIARNGVGLSRETIVNVDFKVNASFFASQTIATKGSPKRKDKQLEKTKRLVRNYLDSELIVDKFEGKKKPTYRIEKLPKPKARPLAQKKNNHLHSPRGSPKEKPMWRDASHHSLFEEEVDKIKKRHKLLASSSTMSSLLTVSMDGESTRTLQPMPPSEPSKSSRQKNPYRQPVYKQVVDGSHRELPLANDSNRELLRVIKADKSTKGLAGQLKLNIPKSDPTNRRQELLWTYTYDTQSVLPLESLAEDEEDPFLRNLEVLTAAEASTILLPPDLTLEFSKHQLMSWDHQIEENGNTTSLFGPDIANEDDRMKLKLELGKALDKAEQENQARAESEEKARLEEKAKAQAEAEALLQEAARAEAEAKAAEDQQRAEAEARVRAEEEARLQAEKEAKELEEKQKRAATKIQSNMRRHSAAGIFNSQRQAGVKIQSFMRMIPPRRRWIQRRAIHAAAIRYVRKTVLNAQRSCEANNRVMIDIAATRLQAQFRQFEAKRRTVRLKTQKTAAMKLQSQMRAHIARKTLNKQQTAAIKIQSRFRSHKEQVKFEKRVHEIVVKAAVRLQACYRAHHAQKQLGQRKRHILKSIVRVNVIEAGSRAVCGSYEQMEVTDAAKYIMTSPGSDETYLIERSEPQTGQVPVWTFKMLKGSGETILLYVNKAEGGSLRPPTHSWEAISGKPPGPTLICKTSDSYLKDMEQMNREAVVITDSGCPEIHGRFLQSGISDDVPQFVMQKPNATFILLRSPYADRKIWLLVGSLVYQLPLGSDAEDIADIQQRPPAEEGAADQQRTLSGPIQRSLSRKPSEFRRRSNVEDNSATKTLTTKRVYYVNIEQGSSNKPPLDGWRVAQHGKLPEPLLVRQHKIQAEE